MQPSKVIEEIARLRDALLPFAELAGDVNMHDPLSKWLTVAHLAEARNALNNESKPVPRTGSENPHGK